MNITLIGLGAIGSIYGNLLRQVNDVNLRVLVDTERKSRYEAEGVYVNGERVPFVFINPGEVTVPADLIIVSVKYNHLPQAIQDIHNHVGENTMIMSLLNGITSEEEIANIYGDEKVIYAISNGIDATREGNGVYCSNPGKISFGKKTNETISPQLLAIKECFDRASIRNDIPLDMEQVLWYKFMINVGINQTSAVTRATYGVFQKVSYAKEIAKEAMMEVVQLAQAQNVLLKEEDIEVFFDTIISGLSEEGKPSMLQDIEAGRLTEVPMFSQKVIDLGQKLQIKTPVNELLFRIIKTLESSGVK